MNAYDVKIKKEMNINYAKQLNSQTQITVCTTHTCKEGFLWSILILKVTILLCFIVIVCPRCSLRTHPSHLTPDLSLLKSI